MAKKKTGSGKKRGPYKTKKKRDEWSVISLKGFNTPVDLRRDIAAFELGPLPEVVGIVPSPSEEEAARVMREKTENAWKQVEYNILNDSEFGAAARLIKNAIDDEVQKRIAYLLRQETASLNETLFRVRDELKAEASFVDNIQQKLSCGTRFDILNEISRLQTTNMSMELLNEIKGPEPVVENHPFPNAELVYRTETDELDFPEVPEDVKEQSQTYLELAKRVTWYKPWTWF